MTKEIEQALEYLHNTTDTAGKIHIRGIQRYINKLNK